jgi:hypothetical protein
MKKLNVATTKLEKSVQKTVNNYAADYNNGVEGFLNDLMQHGCQSGMVGSMIYYTDTIRFYKNHKSEINELLKDMLSETGINSPAEFFNEKWDSEDPLAMDEMNQNLLAWFGFEETARKLGDKAGIEI